MLRDYNYYFYGDPDYSGTAANATQTYTPASSSSSRKSATTTKEEPVDPTLLAQLDAYAERGMTPSGLMELLERWVTEKNISKAQKEQIARSFGC